MSDAETRLFHLLQERSFKLGTFKLASGDISNYYIDGRMTAVFSAGAHLIGEVLYEHTRGLDFGAIGGLAAGAIPLTTAAVLSYHLHGTAKEGFWVRDQVKGHGTQKVIEGNLKPGSRVVIVDDVVTRGTSVIKAVQEVRNVGCEVVLALVLVDRLCGARELFRDEGIVNYQSVFTIRDFGINPGEAK
jgi:orotate phosphoribosyltransferase